MPAVPKGLLFSAMSRECSGGSATELADPKDRASNYLSDETLKSDDIYETVLKYSTTLITKRRRLRRVHGELKDVAWLEQIK